MMASATLNLKGFDYSDLFHAAGVAKLDQAFLRHLHEKNPELHSQLLVYRQTENSLTPLEISELLIACATLLESFIADLFGIQEALAISQAKTISNNPLSVFKKYFVLRRAKKELSKADSLPPFTELNLWLEQALEKAALKSQDKELSIALLGTQFLDNPDVYAADIEQLVKWCTQAISSPEGQKLIAKWTSFHIPDRIDHANLVPTLALNNAASSLTLADQDLRLRQGFKLTDERMSRREVQDQVNYCIYCHDHDGDFCSKGFPLKKGQPELGFKKNPLDITLTGCPLEEKISEMQYLKRDGYTLASLAVIMVDNPMCPATGHRICNDCMKACIYQKQEPVNTPQIETRVLTDVLDLPWGVEIYDLLTRWNPLRQQQWMMKPYNGLKVMIAGMGPAGFTLAHHLLLEGFAVVGFDGLKIEPLPKDLIEQPIYRYADLKESLDERLMAGFGGVAEYGITVRWDKNFLKLIYLSLMRRPHFQVFGGVRFGGTLTIEDAWKMGFDHFALAVGAGLPKALPIPHSLAPGMRQANDFLMALQLGNAHKLNSLTDLQIRLPAVVIGGGLTGVDTATELQAYYIAQVEKTLFRYEELSAQYGQNEVLADLDPASKEILAEYLRHGQAIRQEREQALIEKRQPNFIKLIREWGGVTIAYRRSMQESPAYINNHEELQKALEEGIYYAAGLEPLSVNLNEYGHAETLVCHKRLRNEKNEWVASTEIVNLPARSILVATGTQPNTAYEFEHKGTFNRLNLQYQHYEEIEGELSVAHGVTDCKDKKFGAFTSYQKDDKRVSLIGDTHPVFHGNVVKAIASGTRTYPKILQVLKNKLGQVGNEQEYQDFRHAMQQAFSAHIVSITRQTNNIVELKIKAPLAASRFKPGQFYRLQNFETQAKLVHHTLLQMEPLVLVTAECQHDVLTFLVQETNASSKLCATLKVGQPLALMGPAGVRTKIPSEHETVLIIGQQNSFAFLRNVGHALKTAGNHVIYLATLDNKEALYAQAELEKAADEIIWSVKHGTAIHTERKQDQSFAQHDLLDILKNHTALADVDRIFVVGNTDLLRTFQAARNTVLKPLLLKDPSVIGSVYGNMQCMLKGVCAQCLQWQIDPETGKRTKAVFACSWQDQPLEIVDIEHLDERGMQNKLLAQLSTKWMDYLFEKHKIERV